jgi:hypothetical protein
MNDALTVLFDDMDKAETCANHTKQEVKPNSVVIKALLAIEAIPVFKFAINKALSKPTTRYESLVR